MTAYTYNTDYIQTIQSQLNDCIDEIGDRYAEAVQTAQLHSDLGWDLNTCTVCSDILSSWQQYESGSTAVYENYLSQSQLNNVIKKAKQLLIKYNIS